MAWFVDCGELMREECKPALPHALIETGLGTSLELVIPRKDTECWKMYTLKKHAFALLS